MAYSFKIHERGERKTQTFDKDNINFVKAGKKINVYELIQTSRDDTEIYPTLEKYNCIDRLKLDSEGVYADLRNIKDLRNSIEQVNQAKHLWDNLPLETRQNFGHSMKEFVDKGEQWLKNKIEQNKQKPIEPTKSNPDSDNIGGEKYYE